MIRQLLSQRLPLLLVDADASQPGGHQLKMQLFHGKMLQKMVVRLSLRLQSPLSRTMVLLTLSLHAERLDRGRKMQPSRLSI